MVSVSNLKMEVNIATVLKTAAQMHLVFVSNLKNQVRFFIGLFLMVEARPNSQTLSSSQHQFEISLSQCIYQCIPMHVILIFFQLCQPSIPNHLMNATNGNFSSTEKRFQFNNATIWLKGISIFHVLCNTIDFTIDYSL